MMLNLNFLPSHKSISPTRVSPQLLRGASILCPWRIRDMKKSGINQVIDLRNSAFITRKIEKFFCRFFGIKYYNYKYPYRLYHLPEHDFFEKVNNTIINNNGQTYIHCQYGKRRTSICVAIYEKECLKKPYEEVVSNLYKFGFKDINQKINPVKRNHLLSIYSDFIRRYYPQFAKTLDKD